MALSAESLKEKLEANFEALGYEKVIDGTNYKQYSEPFVEAIAKAIVEEIQQNAQVLDQGSECDGTWRVI